MSLEPRRRIEISSSALLTLISLLGLGWMIAAYLFGNIQSGRLTGIVSAFGVDILKALFIGSSAGVGVNLYLKHALGETPKAILEANGIREIFTDRIKAEPSFQRLIQDQKKTRTIKVMGVSLRDFLIPGGALSRIWQEITDRLEQEQKMNVKSSERLKVRLLLLDPRSSEGRFRHNVEKSTLNQLGLPSDVPQGLDAVLEAQHRIYGAERPDFLEARLYEHCPFAFIFATETEAFSQPYGYRDHKMSTRIPLIKYKAHTPQYDELMYSFDTIWNHAHPGTWKQHHVGTAAALDDSKTRNIFRRDHRSLLSLRQNECLKAVTAGEFVDILAITGNHYISYPIFGTLRDITDNSSEERASVRLAILNPVSQQAILRVVAETSPADAIGDTLRSWNWSLHKSSKLYQDVHHTITQITAWQARNHSFALRLYSSSIACALLLTPTSSFVEQYAYGRSRKFVQGLVLGGEYPVFEYEMDGGSEVRVEAEERIEQEILTSTFNVIWRFYSIPAEIYDENKEPAEFEENLRRLLDELQVRSVQV
jgi:hypothetical protein